MLANMAKQEASPATKKTRTQDQRCVISARPPDKSPRNFRAVATLKREDSGAGSEGVGCAPGRLRFLEREIAEPTDDHQFGRKIKQPSNGHDKHAHRVEIENNSDLPDTCAYLSMQWSRSRSC
jgi:hypothetical protein